MSNIGRFRTFVQDLTELVGTQDEESVLLEQGSARLTELISEDDWLPSRFAEPHPDHYQQYLLFCDPLERFSVVSFVWGPGQSTPVHDHTVWGLIGVMRGAELCDEFSGSPRGIERRGQPEISPSASHRLEVGEIDRVSPTIGDIHKVSNALADKPSISIHVYGANIGAVRRHVFAPDSGLPAEFISGYSSDVTPNLWDRSGER